MRINPLKLDEAEMLKHYRSIHPSTNRMSDEELLNFIEMARNVAHIVIKSEQRKFHQRNYAKEILLKKGYSEKQIEEYYLETKLIDGEICKKNKKIDEDYRNIVKNLPC